MSTLQTATAAGVLTAAAPALAGASPALVVLFGITGAAAMTDARENRIPNALSLVATVTAALAWVQAGAPLPAALIAVVGALTLHLMWVEGALGGGDVKFVPSLILAVASVGDPVTSASRAVLLVVVLLGVAICWAGALAHERGPLLVGGPLALAVSLTL